MTKNTYLKDKNFPSTTQISSLKFVFIVMYKSNARIYIIKKKHFEIPINKNSESNFVEK